MKIPTSKNEIIDNIAEQAEISKAAASRAFNTMIESIVAALKAGETISLLGFGTFSVKPRAARAGRNPKTGAVIQIEATKIPFFKASKTLKDAVNSGSVVSEEG